MEEEKKDERMVELEARIKEPLIWDSPPNCRIQELKEPLYDDVLRLIKHHYFREDPMCKAIALLEDSSSVTEYLDLIKIWLKDTTSIVAISTASNRVIGAAITRMSNDFEKIDTYNRVQIIQGEALRKIMRLKNTLIKETNAYEKFGHGEYLRLYILCVHPSYQGKGIDVALLRVCLELARTLNMPAIGGIFTSGRSQSLAETVGFALMAEIRYNTWIIEDKVIFDDPGRGNYSAAFMGMLLPPEEKPDEPQTSG